MPDEDFKPDETGQTCFVSGYGTLSSGGDVSNILQWVGVPFVTNEECQESYPFETITDTMICAGYPEGGKDPCPGDSGGPLVCKDMHDDGRGSGNAVITGIVSSGYGCAQAGQPGFCLVSMLE